jgi:hypothetical protein
MQKIRNGIALPLVRRAEAPAMTWLSTGDRRNRETEKELTVKMRTTMNHSKQ